MRPVLPARPTPTASASPAPARWRVSGACRQAPLQSRVRPAGSRADLAGERCVCGSLPTLLPPRDRISRLSPTHKPLSPPEPASDRCPQANVLVRKVFRHGLRAREHAAVAGYTLDQVATHVVRVQDSRAAEQQIGATG